MSRAIHRPRVSQDREAPVATAATIELIGAILAAAARQLISSGTGRAGDIRSCVHRRPPFDLHVTHS